MAISYRPKLPGVAKRPGAAVPAEVTALSQLTAVDGLNENTRSVPAMIGTPADGTDVVGTEAATVLDPQVM